LSRWLQMLAVSICMGTVFAAQSRATVPEQSPRKALLEMLLGGEDALRKHLTLEVQRQIGQSITGSASAGMNPIALLSLAKEAGSESLETYEAGPVLLSYENPVQHQKIEIRIDGDDRRGTEDQMRLSLHSLRNGVEEELPAALRFTLSWKAQQNVWRLNAITVSATVPIGDPRVFDPAKWDQPHWDQAHWNLPTLGPSGAVSATRGATVAGVKTPTVVEPKAETSSSTPPIRAQLAEAVQNDLPVQTSRAKAPLSDSAKMPPVRAVRLIGLAEDIYAQKHPGAGFTCFLSELVNIGRGFEDGETYKFIDPELAQGVYNGYRFMLTACTGSPVNSFQIVAEPVSGSGRAYCSNPSHELRGSDDGHGATCLASGKVVQR